MRTPATRRFQGSWCVGIDSGLFFATAQALDDRIRALAEQGPDPLRGLVLDLEAVPFIDSQGAAQLAEIHQLIRAQGATLRLARVKPPVLAVLQRDGLVDLIGPDHVHGNIHRAVEAQLAGDAYERGG